MMTLSQALLFVDKTLQETQMPHSKQQAEDLLCELLGYSRSELYLNRHLPISEEDWKKALEWAHQRNLGKPLAYLSGKVNFYHCELQVNPDVLIPRPETEILVDKIVTQLKKEDHREKILWDVCCGSGCIGIALKKALPELTVFLSDLSPQAIALAKHNSENNAVIVECLIGDCFASFKGQKAHYIVCNPPYLSEEEYEELDREVKAFEPRLALVGGMTGLEYYERMARELPHHLFSHGKVWFEIGYRQGKAVQELFTTPPWYQKKVENDWAGHSRFFLLEIE